MSPQWTRNIVWRFGSRCIWKRFFPLPFKFRLFNQENSFARDQDATDFQNNNFIFTSQTNAHALYTVLPEYALCLT